ncbi:MAG: acyltransferase [Clostridium sp.]|nr:acyltransferase [Clostridium sp.]
MKRSELADYLKGYACFLVVFFHVDVGVHKAGVRNSAFFSEPLEIFIATYAIALFIFLSGYVYHISGEWESKGNSRLSFILYKLLNLGVPYFTFSSIYIVMNSMTSGVNNKNNLADIFLLWKQPVAQYWFLYTLFILFFLWNIMSLFLNNMQITIIICLLNCMAHILDIQIPLLGEGFGYALCFGLGTYFSETMILGWSIRKKILLIIGHILLISIFIYNNITGILIIGDIENMIGIAASIALISMLVKNDIIKKVLLFIKKYSFPIYLLHPFFSAAVRIGLNKAGISNYWIHIVVAMIFGIVGPALIAKITKNISILDFFFYPSKNIRKRNV